MTTKFEYSQNIGEKIKASVKFEFSVSGKSLSSEDYAAVLKASQEVKKIVTKLEKEIE